MGDELFKCPSFKQNTWYIGRCLHVNPLDSQQFHCVHLRKEAKRFLAIYLVFLLLFLLL